MWPFLWVRKRNARFFGRIETKNRLRLKFYGLNSKK